MGLQILNDFMQAGVLYQCAVGSGAKGGLRDAKQWYYLVPAGNKSY